MHVFALSETVQTCLCLRVKCTKTISCFAHKTVILITYIWRPVHTSSVNWNTKKHYYQVLKKYLITLINYLMI